ncbi:MAG: hypothetical protein JJT95_17240, partial [Pararhodobacter sp.]|nr:hypothetical protein [Pararhodobacter sp.]
MSGDAVEALRRALWAGPLEQAEAPGRALAGAIAGGLRHGEALGQLRVLHGARLPRAAALAAAAKRWPRSLDIALIAAESQAGEPPDATRALRRRAARLPGGGSRHHAPARLLWGLG